MRKTILFCFLFSFVFLGAAENLGVYDPDSNSYTVRGKGYSFHFFEGHMFPLRFTIGKKEMPHNRCIDSVKYKGKIYSLNLERWSKVKVITNTAEEFTIEFEGKFWNNDRPRASAVEKVRAIYRYTFLRNTPGFRAICRLVKLPGFNEPLRIAQTLAFTWVENFAGQIKYRGGDFEPVKLKKYYDIHKSELTFAGKDFVVTMKSPRVIGQVNPDGWRSKIMMNGGLWGVDWKTPEIKFEMQLLLGEK